MKLSDQIIEHGPFTWDGHQQEPRPDISGQLCDAAALNELREELMAAQKLRETLKAYEVAGRGSDDNDVEVTHNDCSWFAQHDAWTTLAELVQRTEEHAEVCR